VAGIGNLLADQILWAARLNPGRRVDKLTDDDIARLLRATRASVRAAIRDGGVHTLKVIPFRVAGAHCPRDGAPMAKSTVGGRTSWWCSVEQALAS
jgi:formamidopyrimidine-DNA glycosylase